MPTSENLSDHEHSDKHQAGPCSSGAQPIPGSEGMGGEHSIAPAMGAGGEGTERSNHDEASAIPSVGEADRAIGDNMELDTQAIEHDLEEPYDPELFDRSSDGPKRVVLEPALEERVAGMSAEALITMAKIHERWARQLRVKARIMLADSNEPKENPMRELSIRELATN